MSVYDFTVKDNKGNFAKFLIDKDGNVVDRFAPSEKPETLVSSIEARLGR